LIGRLRCFEGRIQGFPDCGLSYHGVLWGDGQLNRKKPSTVGEIPVNGGGGYKNIRGVGYLWAFLMEERLYIFWGVIGGVVL
jgi:hypothetical protein